MITFWVGGIHYPKIGVFAGAARGHVSDTIALRRPGAQKIARSAVRQQSDVAGGAFVAIELEPLTAADIFLKDDVVAGVGMETAEAHCIREESELVAFRPGSAD